MELTQRIECTQEPYNSKNEKTSPEQIGFLGICGTKYPLKKGPNKIGRDPESCNIVLNLNSISRQHAVINILNNHDFMLMDLDSANKTKLSDKILSPYIPYPLKNGDMVQFGQAFGVFRLFKEVNDLPMTQAIEIPDTPASSRHVSKLNNVHATTIPESPDVSDRDDSFIAVSQHKSRNVFKSPNNNFLISSGKTISIKPIGTNKIDNVYWSSSKTSDSFTTQFDVPGKLNDSATFSKSHINEAKQSIHELNTQVLYSDHNETVHCNNNAHMTENAPSTNIYDMETQMPVTENLPEVVKIRDHQNLALNNLADNKENDNDIFKADTQVKGDVKSPRENEYLNKEQTEVSISKDNMSDDVILFDEIDSQPIQGDFYSQPLLSPKIKLATNERQPSSEETEKNNFVSQTRSNQLKSDSYCTHSTDCEDIFMAVTQEIPKAIDIDENLTDCEDEPNPSVKSNKNLKNTPFLGDDVTDCEDEFNDNDVIQPNKPLQDHGFEDLPTQILENAIVDDKHEVIDTNSLIGENPDLEKTPTRIVEDKNERLNNCKGKINIDNVSKKQFHTESQKHMDFAELITQQIYSKEMVRFKVPVKSPIKKKKSFDAKTNINKCTKTTVIVEDDHEQYYKATQELFNDLCSQKTLSTDVEISNISATKTSDENKIMDKEQVKKCKQVKTRISSQESFDASDVEERINNFVSNLSCSQIREVVGVQKDLNINKKVSSDTSDLEMTPKKINCRAILDTDLPNTQEIKNATHYTPNTSDTESLCDSNESESNNEQDITKRSHQKTKRNIKIKINLSEKFDPASLPVRSSSRLKKTREKLQNIKSLTKACENILMPRSHKKQIEIKKDNKNVSEKSNKSINKISDNICSKSIKNRDIALKSVKKEEKVDKKDDNVSGCIMKENITDRAKQTDKTNNNKRKAKSIDTVTKERNNEQNSATVADRKTRSHNNNITDNVSAEKEKSKRDNKLIRKDNRKPLKDKTKSSDKEQCVSGMKSIMKPGKTSKDFETHDTEVRRSRRNRSGNKSEDSSTNILKTKSTSHEQSLVYSISDTTSESGIDSPNRLKRSATKEIDMPNAKKSKSSETNGKYSSYRATPARKVRTHHVLFTAFSNEEVKDKLETLGAVVVSDVKACTVVLTLQIKRTFKLLCAVGLGKPIVGPNWVQACVDTNMIVDPWLYLINDEPTEKRFQFSLQRSLVGKRDFLKGYNISSTPSVMPNAAEMKLIVECSGGSWKEGQPNWICVSAPADRALWAGLKRKGAVIVSTEFILGGALRQQLDIDKNKLI